MICFDTNIIIHASHVQVSPGQEYKSSRVKAYLARLARSSCCRPRPWQNIWWAYRRNSHKVVRLSLEAQFLLAPLDAEAAQVAARLLQAADIKRARSQHNHDRPSVRVDALILGVAIARGASRVVTYDLKHFRQLARGEIEVIEVPEIHGRPVLFE